MKKILILVALLFAAQWLSAQDTQAPLPLYINGSGKIVPFQDGDMLDVGRKYVMTAVPDKGYVFTNWQKVDVFTFITYEYNFEGQIVGVETNTVLSLVPPLPGKNRVVHFTMEAPVEITADGENPEITQSFGWQANFVPAPQKRNSK